MIKVHAIDTRGLVDKMGCTECKCDLYNVTKDENGEPLRPDYKGGMFCCYDQMQCRLREGFDGTKRSLYLRYTVMTGTSSWFMLRFIFFMLRIL